ncbi:hypothetical protein NP233_g6574 [Leucocoprinus birnbaumii]|uniref:Uncharacterized protein n=1 Tax=Leucocoprinus birnbaumii TaxID=56174 RepID=A0AAD5YTJ6_9AGAR|nr:hypothetical protein NP233_g6574 [Leucocoprinus birnbaumii]
MSQLEAIHDSAVLEQMSAVAPPAPDPGINSLHTWLLQTSNTAPVAIITTRASSNLARLYTEHLAGHLAATYFLSDACSNDPRHLVATLSLQLATKSPRFSETLDEIFRQNPTVLSKSLRVQFRILVLEPVRDLMASDAGYQGRVIMIDGFNRFAPWVRREILRSIAAAVVGDIELHWLLLSAEDHAEECKQMELELGVKELFWNVHHSRQGTLKMEKLAFGRLINSVQGSNFCLIYAVVNWWLVFLYSLTGIR